MEKIKFAQLVSYISAYGGRALDEDAVREVQALMTAASCGLAAENIDNLLAAMKEGRKIEAIKHYRALTSSSLIDAKNAIERHYEPRSDGAMTA